MGIRTVATCDKCDMEINENCSPTIKAHHYVRFWVNTEYLFCNECFKIVIDFIKQREADET